MATKIHVWSCSGDGGSGGDGCGGGSVVKLVFINMYYKTYTPTLPLPLQLHYILYLPLQ